MGNKVTDENVMNIGYDNDICIGYEPSLMELIAFVNKHPECINKSEKLEEVLEEYEKTSKSQWISVADHYYLYGQVLVGINEPLTRNVIQNAIDSCKKRFQEYGGPCNSFEAASIQHTENLFRKLLKLLNIYYCNEVHIQDFLYRTGDSGYEKTKENFINRT